MSFTVNNLIIDQNAQQLDQDEPKVTPPINNTTNHLNKLATDLKLSGSEDGLNVHDVNNLTCSSSLEEGIDRSSYEQVTINEKNNLAKCKDVKEFTNELVESPTKQANLNEPKESAAAAPSTAGKLADKGRIKEDYNYEQNTDNQCMKRTLIDENQLAQFVSTCVPENKRILCLIVRDKMSKLNRARSYFYPTYYLFIQAIVDIDDMNAFEQKICLNSDEDLTAGDTNAHESVDNSFSASSSISADMKFIGTETAQNDHVSNLIQVSGNSYSDNEVCGEIEDDLGVRCPFQAGDFTTNPHTGTQERRDHALVFPNQTPESVCSNKGNQMITKGSPADLNESKLNTCETREDKWSRKPLTDIQPIKRSVSTDKQQHLKSADYRRNEKAANQFASLDDDDCGDEDELDDEDSDNEDGFNDSKQMPYAATAVAASGGDITNNKEADLPSSNNILWDLFENDKNPFTGTYGVLLAGRRRKKAKT